MSKIKNELATRCELAMMGKVIPCNIDEAQAMTDYILTTMKASYPETELEVDILKDHLHQYSDNSKVKYITTNKMSIMSDEFFCITYLIDDEEEPFPEDLATQDGVLCYVYNLTAPELSEFGYCFFEKKNDTYYHRIA